MCRRIFTHYMHHDVAAPMIIDPADADANATVYANPLRTNFHRCELELPPLRCVFDYPPLPCPYHSCCIPYIAAEYCDAAAFGPYNDDIEPEECDRFILEHHHERLPYFGHEEEYLHEVPATWRDLARLRDDGDAWFPAFARDPACRAQWEELFFGACERLHGLELDTRTVFNTARDQLAGVEWWSYTARRARLNLLAAESLLRDQRLAVAQILEWAFGRDEINEGFV